MNTGAMDIFNRFPTEWEAATLESDSDFSTANSYASDIIEMMRGIVNQADDVFWINQRETVFDRCWHIVEKHEGRERLELEFPDCA